MSGRRLLVGGLLLSLFVVAGCADGKSATVTKEPAGANCANGGVKVQVGDGAATYVCDGAKGADGSVGPSATVTPEAAGANCAQGGVKVQVGTGTATYVCNGEDGAAGPGATITAEPAGANCAAGGVKVQVGTGTPTYVCDGADGANGTDGTDGTDGLSATVTPEPPGANCASGGVKVQVGTGTPAYACNGSNAGATKYVVYVIGHLASAVRADNKAAHDAIVNGHRATVTAAGDEKHLVFLGAPGTNQADPNWGEQNFLGIDVWNDLAGFQAFASDPAVQAAFGTLFDQVPTFIVTTQPAGFSRWGAFEPKVMDFSTTTPTPITTFAVLVRGTLLGATANGRQAAHNQVADGGKAAAGAMGDYAHLPCLDMTNDTHFVNLDLWDNQAGMTTFLTDPNVQAAFGSLFDLTDTTNPVSFGVYTTSDFAQY